MQSRFRFGLQTLTVIVGSAAALMVVPEFRCAIGLAGCAAPSAAERGLWEGVSRAGDHKCEALRQYLRTYPTGAFEKQAQTLLAARSEVALTDWTAFERGSTTTGQSSLNERGSEEAACASAQTSASQNADRECQVYREEPRLYRRISTVLSQGSCDCRNLAFQVPGAPPAQPAWRCTVSKTFVCRGEQSTVRTRENCGS
jgi:hypothetical protein